MSISAAISPLLASLLPVVRMRFAAVLLPCLMLAAIASSVHASDLEDAGQLLKSGQHAKALELVDRHLSSKPKDAQGRFLKGIILTGLNKQNDAINIFKKLTEDYPELPEPHNNLAVIYAQQKQYEKAREALEMAIRTHPAYTTAHENLGDIYSRLASQAYGKALQLDSSNSSAQTKLSMINDLVGGKPSGTSATPLPTAPATPTPPPPPVKPVSGKPIESKPLPLVSPPPPKTDAKPEPRVEPRIEPKPEPKPEPKSEAKTEPKPEPKVETKPEPKPEPKVESKPEPKSESKPEPSLRRGSPEAEITAMVDAWLAAWSRKDVGAYLTYYAKDFDPQGKMSRKEWETERVQKVSKPGKIDVGRAGDLNITVDGKKATVRFRQSYNSATFDSLNHKTLQLLKHDGKWLILQERAGK